MSQTGFWKKLPRPFFALAPMADVTDFAFRTIIGKYGKPDVFWTEFVSADGLAHPKAREKLLIDLRYDESERPIVAQIFSGNPDNIREAARLCAELGFDGVDINMGCPDRKVEKQKAGAYCMRDAKLARAVISAAKAGAGGLPVSVKTRLGYNKIEFDFLREILEEGVAALTVHLRTRKEMSKVPAHWDLMPEIVALRDKVAPETFILGNGDVRDLADARDKVAQTGCDGVMLGRAIFGNPFLFSDKNDVSLEEKLQVMIEHTKLFERELGAHKNFAIMKKHYKAYVEGFAGAKELRVRLMEAENASEVESITLDFLQKSK